MRKCQKYLTYTHIFKMFEMPRIQGHQKWYSVLSYTQIEIHKCTNTQIQNMESANIPSELIFVTDITDYICGENSVMWRNFSYIKNLNNLSSFYRNLCLFCSNLCGEKFSPKVRMWRKMRNIRYVCARLKFNIRVMKAVFCLH